MKSALQLIPGIVFGAGLAVSGMTNPGKVLGFLDVAGGAWDPSLAFVMVGAIGVFAILNFLVHKRAAPLLGGSLPGLRATGSLDGRLFAGASLFGLGWGIGGVCPGPALTGLSSLKPELFSFVVAMLVGMFLAQRLFGADAPEAKAPSTGADSPV